MPKIGIVNYKDVLNSTVIGKVKDALNNVCMLFKDIASDTAVQKREDTRLEVYTAQYQRDIVTLVNLRNNAQEIADKCNEALFKIQVRGISSHMYDLVDEDEEDF